MPRLSRRTVTALLAVSSVALVAHARRDDDPDLGAPELQDRAPGGSRPENEPISVLAWPPGPFGPDGNEGKPPIGKPATIRLRVLFSTVETVDCTVLYMVGKYDGSDLIPVAPADVFLDAPTTLTSVDPVGCMDLRLELEDFADASRYRVWLRVENASFVGAETTFVVEGPDAP